MNDLAPGIERWLRATPIEGSSHPIPRGTLPAGLAGTYYLNGPGTAGRAGVAYRHWLDGDGLVTRIHFPGDGTVAVTHRFVGSTKHREEEAAGRLLFRTFGTALPGDRLRRTGLESPANVSAYPWAGRLLAFGEQALPWELDPETLETREEYRFGGRLNEVSPLSAHPSIDPKTHEMWNFGISYAFDKPTVTLYRFADGVLAERFRVPLPYPATVHDFGLSPSYAIWHLSPYLLDVQGLLNEGKSVIDCLSWQPELGSFLHIARRTDGALLASVPASGYVLHWINAFEDGDRLVLDVVELEAPVYGEYQVLPDLLTNVLPGRPVRYVVDTRSWTVIERRVHAYRQTPDFPAFDLQHAQEPTADFWLLGLSQVGRPGRKFFDQLVRLNLDHPEAPRGLYQSPPGTYLGGEPVFLPAPTGAGGSILCQQFDSATDQVDFVLFDAFALEAGPRARIPLANPIPPGFHASWESR